MKKLLLIFCAIAFMSTAQGQNADKARAKLKELFPQHPSISYSLYTDFYEFGFYDMEKGSFVYALIDVEGNEIATTSDNDEIEFDAKIAACVTDNCDYQIIKKGKTATGDLVYILTCSKPKSLNAIYIIDENYQLIRKGQRE